MVNFVTTQLSAEYDVLAPDGSEIRLLPQLRGGSMAHAKLLPGQVSLPVAHKTVEEIWYVLAGTGEIWRKSEDSEAITTLAPGVAITIPLGTHFQFRNISNAPLEVLLITMPPWPGEDEAYSVSGRWPTE